MNALLIVDTGDALPDRLELLPERRYTIGRSRACDLVLRREEYASRTHMEFFFEGDRWFIRDRSLNGTKIDDQRVRGVVSLQPGQVVQIGAVRIRFTTPSLEANRLASSGVQTPPDFLAVPAAGASDTDLKTPATTLHHLCRYMLQAVRIEEVGQLLQSTLELLREESQASLVGYVSNDPSDPEPRMVLPASENVNAFLSRQLSERIRRLQQPIWLSEDHPLDASTGGSLAGLQDALGLPLMNHGMYLGELHAYRREGLFSQDQVEFSRTLAEFCGSMLYQLRRQRMLEAEYQRLRNRQIGSEELLGDSKAIRELRTRIEEVAAIPNPVLISGAAGLDKEQIAAKLHSLSGRALGPFIAVNCDPALTTRLDVELFGARRGAGRGRTDETGALELAQEGILYLESIEELPLELQDRLLPILLGEPFCPLGSSEEIKPDVRIVASTNVDLKDEVRSGRFRVELWRKLARRPIRIPALERRAEDIPTLVEMILRRLRTTYHRHLQLTQGGMRKLQTYDWPGNIQQLRAVLETAVALWARDQELIEAEHLKLPSDLLSPDPSDMPASLSMKDVEFWAYQKVLQQTNHNISQASTILGISRDTIHSRIREWRTEGKMRDRKEYRNS